MEFGAIAAAINWLKSLKEVVSSEEFRIKWENIIASDDTWWKKALDMLGFGFESQAASLVGLITQFFGISGSEAWKAIKGWFVEVEKAIKGGIDELAQCWRNVLKRLKRFWNNVKETVAGWVENYIIDPIKSKWQELTDWCSSLSIANLFGLDGEQAGSVSVDTQPAMSSLDALNKYLDEFDGKTVTATVNVRKGGGGTTSTSGGGKKYKRYKRSNESLADAA